MESEGTTARRRFDPQVGELAGEVKRSEYRTDESQEAAMRILNVQNQQLTAALIGKCVVVTCLF